MVSFDNDGRHTAGLLEEMTLHARILNVRRDIVGARENLIAKRVDDGGVRMRC